MRSAARPKQTEVIRDELVSTDGSYDAQTKRVVAKQLKQRTVAVGYEPWENAITLLEKRERGPEAKRERERETREREEKGEEKEKGKGRGGWKSRGCLLYTSPSPRDGLLS
eukprot:443587-Pleurochrysis_carterae.AAC.1